jgi:glutathione S-transferase
VKLYGTTTSPFVRRVRVVAAEVGEPVELVNTARPEGQAALRELTPIGKVPIAILDGRAVFDSRVIIDWLIERHGWAGLEPPRDRWRAANVLNAVDEALGAVLPGFYMKRDGVAIGELKYCADLEARTRTILDHLGGELVSPGIGFSSGLDLATLSLVCALDWMDFRQSYPTDRHPALAPVRAAWAERASLVATRPHV